MANLPIPDEQTWIQYDSYTGTGPLNFSFSVFSKADLTVSVDGVALDQSDFTLTGTLIDSGYDGGYVTLVDATADAEILIVRNVTPVRTTDFAPANNVPIVAVDAALDRLTATDQDARRDLDRAILVPLGDGETLLLPDAETRSNRLLGFNSTGGVTTYSQGSGDGGGGGGDYLPLAGGTLTGPLVVPSNGLRFGSDTALYRGSGVLYASNYAADAWRRMAGGDPVDANDFVTKGYADLNYSGGGGGAYLPLTGGTIAGDLAVSGHMTVGDYLNVAGTITVGDDINFGDDLVNTGSGQIRSKLWYGCTVEAFAGGKVRTLEDRFGDVINLMDFLGTVNDGTGDTAPTWAAAMIEAQSRHRATIYIPAGTYLFNSTISWSAGATDDCINVYQDPGAVLLFANTGTDWIQHGNPGGIQSVEFEWHNLRCEPAGGVTHGAGFAINMDNVRNTRFYHAKIKNPWQGVRWGHAGSSGAFGVYFIGLYYLKTTGAAAPNELFRLEYGGNAFMTGAPRFNTGGAEPGIIFLVPDVGAGGSFDGFYVDGLFSEQFEKVLQFSGSGGNFKFVGSYVDRPVGGQFVVSPNASGVSEIDFINMKLEAHGNNTAKGIVIGGGAGIVYGFGIRNCSFYGIGDHAIEVGDGHEGEITTNRFVSCGCWQHTSVIRVGQSQVVTSGNRISGLILELAPTAYKWGIEYIGAPYLPGGFIGRKGNGTDNLFVGYDTADIGGTP